MFRGSRSIQVPDAIRPERAVLVAFAILVLIGGSNAVAVRFSNLDLPPFWGAGTRFAAAALIFWIVVLLRRVPVPRGRSLVGAALYGLLQIGLSYAFLYWGLLRVQANLTMVVLALIPLLTVFLAWIHRLERLGWRRLAGAVIALSGILVVVGEGLGSRIPVTSFLALLAAAACAAESGVILKLLPGGSPLATNAVALTIGAALLVGLSRIAGEEWSLPAAANTWIAFAYLVVLGSVVLFYLYLYVLARWTASATAYAALLFPLATVPIAAVFAGEAITLSFIVGGVLGLFGVWFGAVSGLPRAIPADSAATAE